MKNFSNESSISYITRPYLQETAPLKDKLF